MPSEVNFFSVISKYTKVKHKTLSEVELGELTLEGNVDEVLHKVLHTYTN